MTEDEFDPIPVLISKNSQGKPGFGCEKGKEKRNNVISGAVVLQHEITQITNCKGINTAVFSELSLSLICIGPEVSLGSYF